MEAISFVSNMKWERIKKEWNMEEINFEYYDYDKMDYNEIYK